VTCILNEAVALNTRKTSALITKNRVVTIKADKTHAAPDVDKLLKELGNAAKALPFYAIYPAGGGKPILFDGLLSQKQVLDALKQAGPSSEPAKSTAMK